MDGKFKTSIKSYLTGRQQKAVLGSKGTKENTSKWEKIKCGVTQGSILGPLFYLLYINDLPKVLNGDNNVVLYADDRSIVITDTNIHNFKINLIRTFGEINTWFNANLLTVNSQKKTHYIEFWTKNDYKSPTLIEYDQRSVTVTVETKFLGSIIDDNLYWEQHREYIINKLALVCYAVRNIRSSVTLDKLRSIYFTHVYSVMSYGIMFFFGVGGLQIRRKSF
jgi:hypothetical protein